MALARLYYLDNLNQFDRTDKMRQKLLLLAAVFFGVLAFVLTFHQIQVERQKALGSATWVVLTVMKSDKTSGEELRDDDIAPARVRRFKSNLSREIPWDRRNSIIGRKLTMSVQKGHFLEWSDVESSYKRGRGGIADKIPMGSRAISISVDATSSVTGLIQPFNKVDIIGTFRFPEQKGDMAYDTLTLTILQNVVILATGTDYNQKNLSSDPRVSRGYSTVTLALTPEEVEMIVFASQKGRLTLSLRNHEETMMTQKLQSVNFKYLEENIQKYNQEREKRMKRGVNLYK